MKEQRKHKKNKRRLAFLQCHSCFLQRRRGWRRKLLLLLPFFYTLLYPVCYQNFILPASRNGCHWINLVSLLDFEDRIILVRGMQWVVLYLAFPRVHLFRKEADAQKMDVEAKG